MADARLVAITLERFKSYRDRQRIELKPLTVLLGRNNSGKSTIIQALLLLKQTLMDPSPEVPLKLEGYVDATSLRELTWGWPDEGEEVEGPTIGVEWTTGTHTIVMKYGMEIYFTIKNENIFLKEIIVENYNTSSKVRYEFLKNEVKINLNNEFYRFHISLFHFIPLLSFNKEMSGQDISNYHTYMMNFKDSLYDLHSLIILFQFLSSTPQQSSSLYRTATVTPQEIGINGENAAKLLQKAQRELVHYLPPLDLEAGSALPDRVRVRPMVEAVNEVMAGLGVDAPVRVHEIQNIGFQLFFGDFTIAHVGRGLTYLLPLVQLGLYSDPLRFSGEAGEMGLAEYSGKCGRVSHIAIEEPESHIHPKVQSRLAHWLVSLAMCERQVTVETHSDHLVRRLRGLMARAGAGSELEKWLLENVSVLEVVQDAEGASTVTASRLTEEGGLEERWPADFMDEASEEDSAIFYGAIAKRKAKKAQEQAAAAAKFIHDEGDEDEGGA